MTDPDPIVLTDEIVTRIAEEAGCHPQSVLRRFAGLTVRGARNQAAIDAALERHGVRVSPKGAK